jgi:MgtC family
LEDFSHVLHRRGRLDRNDRRNHYIAGFHVHSSGRYQDLPAIGHIEEIKQQNSASALISIKGDRFNSAMANLKAYIVLQPLKLRRPEPPSYNSGRADGFRTLAIPRRARARYRASDRARTWWRRREAEPGSRTAGIRTFAISGLLGGIVGAIAQTLSGFAGVAGGIVLATGFATYAVVITIFSREENRADKTFSATTAVAGMLTFALGAYALVGDVLIASGAAVAAAALLPSRETLHGWIEKLTWPELRSESTALVDDWQPANMLAQHEINRSIN